MTTLADLQTAIEENRREVDKVVTQTRILRAAMRCIADGLVMNHQDYAQQVLREIGDR